MTTTCSRTGLTSSEVAQRVTRGQVNRTHRVTSRPLAEIIKANVFTRFNAILGALLVLVLATGSFGDALFGLALVINTAFGIAQEYAAKRKLDSLAVLHAPTSRVVRDGAVVEVPIGEVVLDDVIELRPGDQVPADGVTVTSQELEVDESNLTGESDPVAKHCGDEVHSGTVVVAGSGRMCATVVGAATQANALAEQARTFTRAYSEVQGATNVLLRYLTWVVVIALPVTIWSQATAPGNHGWRQVVVRAAGGLVGLIPEGLVLLTTLAFVLAAWQLTKRQALVQELPAVEGLARVDVICLDKTGTLTFGDIAFDRLEPLEQVPSGTASAALGAMSHQEDANGTARALARAIDAPGWERTAAVPFTSARKYSAATFTGHGTWVLGAPDVLTPHLDPAPPGLPARVAELAGEGLRVVLLATTTGPVAAGDPLPTLQAAALVVLTERVRPDAAQTLRYFADQGVAVKVISGDSPATVAAVARRVGLDVGEPVDARTMTGDPDELADLADSTVVFGRVGPEQKRALVRALQSRGHTVAMTGDGVNDVLALKDADIGVAMGNGAPATKAVAQLVLLDGRFANLPRVLAEGRRLIANVERVANLFVAKNIMSAVAIFATAFFGFVFPLLPRQLTLVSTMTIGIPAAILALGPNPRRYRPGFLRRVLTLSLPAGAAAGAAAFTAYWVAHERHGLQPLQAGTTALVALLIVSFWLLGVLARPYLWWKVVVIAAMIAGVVLAFALPVGREFFRIDLVPATLPAAALLGLAGGAVVEVAYRRGEATRE